MACSRPTSWPNEFARPSTVRTTSIYPLPKMLLDRAACRRGEGGRLDRMLYQSEGTPVCAPSTMNRTPSPPSHTV